MSRAFAAQARIDAAFATQAERAAIFLLKRRARAFADRPATLDVVSRGLSLASPEALVAKGREILAIERRQPRRWFGFGAEAPAVNARALILLGRLLRRRRGRSTSAAPPSAIQEWRA